MSRGHKLLTQEIRNSLPKLYSQEKESDPMVYVKFFSPYSNWTWLITEGEQDGDDFRMFGLVKGFETELGYISLNELESARISKIRGIPVMVAGGIPAIERDLHFTPCRLSEARKREGF